MKTLKKISLWILASALLIIGAGVAMGIIYADEVKQIVIKELNKQILAEVDVKEG